VITARGTAKRTQRSEHMNAILLHKMKPRLWHNYAQRELEVSADARFAYQAQHIESSEDFKTSERLNPMVIV